MSKKNATRRRARKVSVQEEATAIVSASDETAEEREAMKRLDRALASMEHGRERLVSRDEIRHIVRRFGPENRESAKAMVEQIVSVRWAARQAGKAEPPPIYLPVLRRDEIDLRHNVVGITKLPFKRPELLPLPGHRLREELVRNAETYDAILTSLPVLPMPVVTSKLLLLCTGLSWTYCTNSFDALRYYMVVARLLRGTSDVIRPEAAAAAERDFDEQRRLVYDELSKRFDAELLPHLQGPTATPETLRRLELWAFDFTHNYLLCYEHFILNYLLQENQTSPATVQDFEQLLHDEKKRRTVIEDGIPRRYAGEFCSTGAHPDVATQCSESLMKDVARVASSLCAARAKLAPHDPIACQLAADEACVAPRYLSYEQLAQLAAFVRMDRSVYDDMERFVKLREERQTRRLEQAGISPVPPPLADAAVIGEEELAERFKRLASTESDRRVANDTLDSSLVPLPGTENTAPFAQVLYSKKGADDN